MNDAVAWSSAAVSVISACIAGSALWLSRSAAPAVKWAVEPYANHQQIRNIGRATAYRVVVQLTSVGSPSPSHYRREVDNVGRDENVPVKDVVTYDSPLDVGIVVTWRGRFGRGRTWVHRLD